MFLCIIRQLLLLSLIVVAIFPYTCHATNTNILLLGDSMTEFMGQTLETFCAGTHVVNGGMSGTTAEEWSSYSSDDIEEACGASSNQWDVVYISVGGNDVLGSDCSMSTNELIPIMESAIENIVTSIAPGASTYVLTGYCMPYSAEEEGSESGCSNPADFDALSNAFQGISASAVGLPAGSSLEIIDSISVCGGSATSFSNGEYFQDAIHLNAKGYCKVFSQSSVQSAMLCDTASGTYDCESLSGDEIFGLDKNCMSGTPETLAPVASPTTVETSSPVSSPVVVTESPVTSPEEPSLCNDSELRFRIEKPNGERIWRDCTWVSTKSTNIRCLWEGISSMCPSTCGTCDSCVDSESRFKFMNLNGKKIGRDCSWVDNKATKQRCNISGVSDSCRETCGAC